jgi:hypothetical protein
MAIDHLAAYVEVFLDHCVRENLAAPHPAGVVRFERYGLPVTAPAPSVKAAESAADAVAAAIPADAAVAKPVEDGPKKRAKGTRQSTVDAQVVPATPPPPKLEAESGAVGQEGGQSKRKRHRHSQEG